MLILIMNKKTFLLILLTIIFISITGSLLFYEYIPSQMPIHWNSVGEIDAYASKEIGAFLLPIVSIIIALIFVAIPYIEPNKKNLKKFIKQYNLLGIIILVFLTYLHYLILFASIVEQINVARFLSPAIGILFFYIGIMLSKAKQNYTVGIRTPWTLASKKNWEETHKKGSTIFKVCGIIAFLGLIFPNYAVVLMLAPILISVFGLFFYSFYIFIKNKE